MRLPFSAIILIAIFCLSGFSACKKYEEGPRVSLRSKSDRVSGDKRIVSYEVDGVDSLPHLDSMLVVDSLFECIDYYFRFIPKGERGLRSPAEVWIISSVACKPYNSTMAMGYWSFENRKNNLDINIQIRDRDTTWIWNNVPTLTASWEIVKLSNEEMWLRLERNGKMHELNFKQYGTYY